MAVCFVFFLFLSLKFIYASSAQRNFETGKYEVAVKQYNLLLLFDPNNLKYKNNLADSLIKLPFTYENQSLICDFLERYEGQPFAYSLEQKLKKYQSNLDVMIGPNYIDKVPMNNKILRWEDDAFPLKVYITGSDATYQSMAKKAFDYWTYTSKNFFSFAYVNSPKDADVTVELIGAAKSNCEEEGCLYVGGVTVPDIKHDILKSMNMTIHTQDPYGKPLYPEDVYKVVLHEIGHVLGIFGHSDNPENIMYSSGKHEETEYFTQYRSSLSPQDINTLNYLYMIVPNISNVPANKHNTVNKIHPSIVLGTEEQIKKRDIENAIKYIQSAPNMAVGYMDLGNAYVQSEMYEKAMEAYKKGFDLSMDKKEKYDFVYNMATTCLRMKNREKALEYAEYAKKLNPTDEINKLIHDIKYPLSLSNPEY